MHSAQRQNPEWIWCGMNVVFLPVCGVPKKKDPIATKSQPPLEPPSQRKKKGTTHTTNPQSGQTKESMVKFGYKKIGLILGRGGMRREKGNEIQFFTFFFNFPPIREWCVCSVSMVFFFSVPFFSVRGR